MVKRPRLGVVIGKVLEDCKPPQVGVWNDVESFDRRKIYFEGVWCDKLPDLVSCFWAAGEMDSTGARIEGRTRPRKSHSLQTAWNLTNQWPEKPCVGL